MGKRQWVEVADYEKSWKVRYHHSIKGILLIAVSINLKKIAVIIVNNGIIRNDDANGLSTNMIYSTCLPFRRPECIL